MFDALVSNVFYSYDVEGELYRVGDFASRGMLMQHNLELFSFNMDLRENYFLM